MEGHGKFLGGAGILKVKIFEAKYEAKLEFPWGIGGGGGVHNKRPSVRKSMVIFWNCTIWQ